MVIMRKTPREIFTNQLIKNPTTTQIVWFKEIMKNMCSYYMETFERNIKSIGLRRLWKICALTTWKHLKAILNPLLLLNFWVERTLLLILNVLILLYFGLKGHILDKYEGNVVLKIMD